MIHCLLSLALFVTRSSSKQTPVGPFVNEDCVRVRRPADELSREELMLYVEGMQQIRANGKYQVLLDSHHAHTEIHRGSSFFFYHTYYVWEVETQIRNLGGKYRCFGMPYYDWTIEAGREQNPWILNTVFGGDGDTHQHNCVQAINGGPSKEWGIEKWPIAELCAPDEDARHGCCLKRNLYWKEGVVDAEGMNEVLTRPQFSAMEGGAAYAHQKVHWLFGLGDTCASCAMATGYSPDDPIFMLLHSYTAYLRAVWATCHGYDRIAGRDLDGHEEAYKAECADGFFDGECGVIELDDVYEFDELPKYPWSITHHLDITPRMMWDFVDWNVQYDPGHFVDDAGLWDDAACEAGRKQMRGSTWFTQPGDDLAPWKKDMEAAASPKTPLPQQSAGHGPRGEEEMVVGGVSVESVEWSQETRVALMAVSALLMSVGVCLYKSNASEGKYVQVSGDDDAAYGTV